MSELPLVVASSKASEALVQFPYNKNQAHLLLTSIIIYLSIDRSMQLSINLGNLL